MISLGSLAPQFGCSAWTDGRVRRLSWAALHSGTLLLLFDAQAAGRRRGMRVLDQAARQLGGVARLALVCHGPVHMIESWARATQAHGEPPALTVILDPEDYLAALYDLLAADGTPFWGQYVIDSAAVVRQAQACPRRVPPDADDLVRYARAISSSFGPDCGEDLSPFHQKD